MAFMHLGRRTRVAILVCIALLMTLVVGITVRLRQSRVAGGRHVTPGLVCNEPDHDFGPVSAEAASDLKHQFVLINTSAKPITIVEKAMSCGCTTVDLQTMRIEPGKSLHIPVVVHWGDRDGPQGARISLLTDESPPSAAKLTLAASVVNPVGVWPQTLEFRRLAPGPSAEQIFEVSRISQAMPFQITDVHSTDPAVRVRQVLASPSASGEPAVLGRFAVQVVAPQVRGIRESLIFVETSLGIRCVVRVRMQSVGVLVAQPPTLHFSSTADSDARTARLTIRRAGGDLQERFSAEFPEEREHAGLSVASTNRRVENGVTVGDILIRFEGVTTRPKLAQLRVTAGEDAIEVPIAVTADVP